MTPTGEAIEEEFDLNKKLDEFREYFDKTLKPKKPTIKNLDRELLVDFIRTAFLAGRQSMAEEIEGSLPAEKEKPKDKCMNAENHLFGSCFQCEKNTGFNDCRAKVLEIIAKKKGV